MSSSVFIEPSVEENGKEDKKQNPDLVVVYGKSGVNIDPKDLETLIEEKAVKTISVIRISSPTPSMEEAEEAARLEAAKEAQEEAAESDEVTGAETMDSKRRDATVDANDSSSKDSEDDNSSAAEQNMESRNDSSSEDDPKPVGFSRRSRKMRRNAKNKKSQAKKHEQKPSHEVMGLTLEGFYEAEAALEIAKEACKLAGIPYIRNTAEYEFMMFVIKNDHCYTPFTSPEQMKAKLAAEKLEPEKLSANIRKVQHQWNLPSKQMLIKAKKLPGANSISSNLLSRVNTGKTVDEAKLRVGKEKTQHDDTFDKQRKSLSTLEDEDDEEESYELIDVEDSDYTGSEQSAESDNDRDSDLDFRVNNRQTKKRRIPLSQKKVRRLMHSKMQDKRTQPVSSQEEHSTTENTATGATNVFASTSNPSVQRQPLVKSRIQANNITVGSKQIRQSQYTPMGKAQTSGTASGTAFPRKAIAEKAFGRPNVSSTTVTLQQGHIVHKGDKQTGITSRSNVKSQSAVKEIVINKALTSPKGCFTELTTLISEAEKSTNQAANTMQAKPTTPTYSMTRNSATSATSVTHSRTGFMRIDASAKNSLPAQISVETHQRSSKLLAEHDKQLDLIDSIVKDELNKPSDIIPEKSSISADENIPKLVQMLESTEKALGTNSLVGETVSQTMSLAPCLGTASGGNPVNTNTNVDDIDISHDLPEDLLQHVVELIEDDKTLQEAVEKEILNQENFNNEALTNAMMQQQQQQMKLGSCSLSNVRTTQLMQQTSPQESSPITPTMLPSTTTNSKSIIQMSISNTTNSFHGNVNSNSNLAHSTPISRRDPIQIVRGNGRVITLPPIEAPTTRAKRRAQVVPSGTGAPNVDTSPLAFNDSSLDGSLHSNASFSAIQSTPMATTPLSTATPSTDIVSPTVEKKSREALAKRRTSKEGTMASAGKMKRNVANRSKRNSTNTNKQEDTEASESQGDDDDPKKLWCICRQPHNNRFMICCDACGDWFHGTCVNVTKAMGREMEQKGIEWSCPQCNKKKEDRSQSKLTDMLQVKRINSQSSLEDKVKIPVEMKTMSTSAETGPEVGETKKTTSGMPRVVQASTAKKVPIVVQGQKKIVAGTPTDVGVQNKLKVLSATPERAAISSTNVVVKTQPQISRAGNVVVQTSAVTVKPVTLCVFCKKAARPNTIYCSDDCIRRSAQNAIHVYTTKSTEQIDSMASSTSDERKKKAKGLFEDVLSMADRKPKVERIVVYDRKSGTRLSGSNAPTTLTIKKWLHDNPTFEVVLPGSQLSIDLEKQQQQRLQVSPKQVGQVRTSIPKATMTATPVKSNLPQSPVNQNQMLLTSRESGVAQTVLSPIPVKVVKQIITDRKPASGSASPTRPNTPRQLQKYPQHVQIKPDNKSPRSDTREDVKHKDRQLKRQSSDASSSGSSNKKSADSSSHSTTTNYDSEPIRMNVRRTLKEQILQRMNEAGSGLGAGTGDQAHVSTQQLKLTPEEVDIFVKETEAEMFNMFRDTGAKYKAKYRSLMFNIKDRKNHTLFAKICAKQTSPKQLVHMSPEELASQELAQWRENENKHQLEMIKKSELDLLSCTKNFLFKNHKGEEVIESKDSNVCVNLDMTIPVEDVVNVLNNSSVSSNNETEEDTTEVSGSDSGLKQHGLSPLPRSGSIETQEHHSYHPHDHHHHHHHQAHQQQPLEAGDKLIEEKSKPNQSDNDKGRERGHEREREREYAHERRHRSRSHDSVKDRGEDRHQRSKSKDSEKNRDRGRDKRHRSREHHHREKSRSSRHSHSRSKSRSRSEEKRLKRESTWSSHRDRDRERERDNEKEKERKEKKNTDNKHSIAAKTSPISYVQSKDKHRNSPTTTGSAKHKPIIQQQKSVECFNLIDQIIESSKTVEEAANLVRESSKEKIKEKPKEHQSPVIATSSTSQESIVPGKIVEHAIQSSSTADSDQEPSSTVSIPTPPHDPYSGEEEASFSRSGSPNADATQIWSGGISMNEVASLQMKLYHLIGNLHHIGRYLPENLDVVGRIDGETVWEYLWKIRRSPNKEIVLLRLMPYNDDEAEPYAKLFQYLDQKKRLGVIKSISPQIKDFYIYPLESGKQLPKVLQVTNHDDFYNDPYRPDMIVGIIVRVLGKRMPISAVSNNPTAKVSRRNRNEAESFTPPGSPKRRKRNHKSDLDIDAIIKAPIVSKTARKPTVMGTDDEPYSPGGSSDEDMPIYSGKSSSLLLNLPDADEDLKRKMEEINRQIAAQEMEIAGLLNVEPTSSASVLANISIPSNLPQILASIKNKDNPVRGATSTQPDRMLHRTLDEYNPEDVIRSSYGTGGARHLVNPSSSTSRLAQLSEAELLRMVPDDMLDPAPSTSSKKHTTLPNVSPYYQEPPPPGV